MCGILCMWNIDDSDINKSLSKLSLRGRDGLGIYNAWRNSEGGLVCEETNKYLYNPEMYKGLKVSPVICLANSRSIPTTEYESGAGWNVQNQQPFMNDRYVVVHNGIISNDKELREEFNIRTDSTVDSSILPALFSELGVVEGMKRLKGSFAILCWDRRTQKIFAGKNFMPLQYVASEKGCMFVSLNEMLPIDKDDLKYATEVPPYTCIEIDINNFSIIEHSLYPRERNKKVMVICSGGIDSVTTAYLYKYLGYDVKLIHFLYGQAAEEVELFAVKNIAKDLGSELIVYDARKIFEPYKEVSLLLHQKKANKEVRMLDAESLTRSQKVLIRHKKTKKAEYIEIGEFIDFLLQEKASDIKMISTGEHLKINDYETLSYGKKLEWKSIHSVYRHIPKESIFKVKCERGIDLELTGGHSVYVWREEGIKLVSAGAITKNDILMTIDGKSLKREQENNLDILTYLKEYKTPGRRWLLYDNTNIWSAFSSSKVKIKRFIKLNKDFMFVLGSWVAEGGEKIWAVKDSEYAKEFKKALEGAFGIKFKLNKTYDVRYKNYNYELSVPVIIERLFKVLLGSGCNSKTIPHFVFMSEYREEFIRGLWKGDGSFDNKRGYNYADLQTTSKKLAEELSLLLKLSGCQVSINKSKKQKENWGEVYEVIVSDRNSYNIIMDIVKGVKKDIVKDKHLNPFFYPVKVKDKVAISYNSYVYDFGIENNENFIAEGYLVHNSTLSYVPNRNATFAMLAAGISEMYECDTVAFGGQQMDSVYPDNNPTFVNAVDNLLKYSLNVGSNIKFTAPLIHLNKHEIVALGRKIGVKYDLICSCYYPKIEDGKVVHCGECGCCSFRENAFKMCDEREIIKGDINIFINKYVKNYT